MGASAWRKIRAYEIRAHPSYENSQKVQYGRAGQNKYGERITEKAYPDSENINRFYFIVKITDRQYYNESDLSNKNVNVVDDEYLGRRRYVNEIFISYYDQICFHVYFGDMGTGCHG